MSGVFAPDGVAPIYEDGVDPINGVDPIRGVLSFQFCAFTDYPGRSGVSENLLGVFPGLRGVLSFEICFFLIYSLMFLPPRGVASHLVFLGVGVS